MRALVLALILTGCTTYLRPTRIDPPPRLQLQTPHLVADELRPNPFTGTWFESYTLTDAELAVQQRLLEERRIKEWNAELRLNELQDQLDGLETP